VGERGSETRGKLKRRATSAQKGGREAGEYEGEERGGRIPYSPEEWDDRGSGASYLTVVFIS